MVKIGFDVFNIANNHSLDKGESGLRNAIKFWKSKNVVFCGAYLDEEDYKTIPTNTVKDIKFAYVGLTESTNGLSLPEGSKTILMLGADEDRIEKTCQGGVRDKRHDYSQCPLGRGVYPYADGTSA